MDSAGVFSTGESGNSPLWTLTWDRINAFLPNLQQELVKAQPPPPPPPPPGTINGTKNLYILPQKNLIYTQLSISHNNVKLWVPRYVLLQLKRRKAKNS